MPSGGPEHYFGEERETTYGKGIAGGTRIPSAEPGTGGGSLGFDPHVAQPYTVVDLSGDAPKVVATVDRTTPEPQPEPQPEAEAEDAQEGVSRQSTADDHATSVAPPPPPPLPAVPAAQPEPAAAPKQAEKVTFLDFGELTVPYDSVFIDGMCLVLVYDRGNEVTFDPPVNDEPLSLRYAGRNFKAYSSGVRFVEPGTSRVFTVLLIE